MDVRHRGRDCTCSPSIRNGESATAKDDFFSLGKLFESVVGMEPGDHYPPELSEGGRRLISRCRDSGSNSFQSARELVLAVNPESSLANLHLQSSAQFVTLGLEEFSKGQFQSASAAWNEAIKHDWLDVAPRNNIAVLKMKENQWEEALHSLDEAYQIYSYHPVVDMNIGYCQWKQDDLEAADFWLNRSVDLNPWFPQPRLLLAKLASAQGHDEVALRHVRNFCAMEPKSKAGREMLAAILDKFGDTREAVRQGSLAASLRGGSEFQSHLMPQDGPSWGRVRSESTPRSDRGFPMRKSVHPGLGADRRSAEWGSV